MPDYNEKHLWSVFWHEESKAGEFERTIDGMRQVRTIDGVICFRQVTEVFSGCPSFMQDWAALPGQCGDGI